MSHSRAMTATGALFDPSATGNGGEWRGGGLGGGWGGGAWGAGRAGVWGLADVYRVHDVGDGHDDDEDNDDHEDAEHDRGQLHVVDEAGIGATEPAGDP